MSGSSGAARKLSPKRTALNLCKITLSRWKRNWVSRASPHRREILWPSSFIKKSQKRSADHETRMLAADRYECQLAWNTWPLFWWRPTQRLHPVFGRSPVCRNPPQSRLLWHPTNKGLVIIIIRASSSNRCWCLKTGNPTSQVGRRDGFSDCL